MSLKDINFKASYGGLSDNIIENFYAPVLEQSNIYKRSVAYFTGGIFSIATSAYKSFFIENNGKFQLVTSPFFDEKISIGYKKYKEVFNKEDLTIDVLNQSLEKLEKLEHGSDLIEFISILLKLNKLEIKIALVPEPGLYHEKIGIFADSLGNSISFSGSINETWSGWISNSEEFKVFNNWDVSKRYFSKDEINFELLWRNQKSDIKVIPLPEAINDKLLKIVPTPTPTDFERKIEELNNIVNTDISKYYISKSTQETSNINKKELMSHQIHVLDSWKQNDYFGLIKHATGSGKTITGIYAIEEWFKQSNLCLVVVPSILLQDQWNNEINQQLPKSTVFLTGGDVPKSIWKKQLKYLSNPNNSEKVVIISTIGTASLDDFIDTFRWGEHLLLIVDEVHRAGSIKSSKLLDQKTGGALGLSATPERYGDEIGTNKIFTFFKKILQPEFTLDDAIECGRLVPYDYFPLEVMLTKSEQESYDLITEKIITLYFMIEKNPSDKRLKEQYSNLLINRARILKKAENKIDLALEIVKNNFNENEHWLIYCDDNYQLEEISKILESNNIKTLKYTSSMDSDRNQTLEYFKTKGGILIAIKCLDEGVDLPYLSNAVVLASSKNPREHIQRRGRVLRKSENKYYATIYDAIVVPNKSVEKIESDSIMSGEITRAYNFAKSARNPIAKINLIELANKYNIEIKDTTYEFEEE